MSKKFSDYNWDWYLSQKSDESGAAQPTKPEKLWYSPQFVTQKANLETYLTSLAQKPEIEDSDNYVCANCKSRKISWRTAQIRRADESQTIFFICRSCGSSWKDSS